MDYSSISTLPNLQPGSQGTDVKKLQTWLIQNGYNIPDGATGNYGPETMKAVAQWQQTSGIDPKGNPGYFGPISKSFIQSQSQKSPTNTNVSSQTPSQDNIEALHFLGFTDAQIQSMSPSDRTNFSLAGSYLKGQTELGNVQSVNNAQTLQKAYTSALNDPNIVNKYSDIQKTDVANFNNMLNAFQTTTDVDTANQRLQFQKQQKDLAEQAAAAGQAYSGFRQQAKQQLDTQQSGIVKSTMAQIKQNLQSSLSPLESYYGSDKLNSLIPNQKIQYNNPLTGGNTYINYNPTGSIAGTEDPKKESDVAQRQGQIYQNTASPI